MALRTRWKLWWYCQFPHCRCLTFHSPQKQGCLRWLQRRKMLISSEWPNSWRRCNGRSVQFTWADRSTLSTAPTSSNPWLMLDWQNLLFPPIGCIGVRVLTVLGNSDGLTLCISPRTVSLKARDAEYLLWSPVALHRQDTDDLVESVRAALLTRHTPPLAALDMP